MSLHILAVSDLLTFSQGMLLGVLFLSSTKGNRYANVLLGLFLLLFNFGSLHSFFLNSGLVNQHKWLLGFPSLFLFWFGPLLYFYTCSLTRKNFNWEYTNLWWFAPAFVELATNFLLLGMGTDQLITLAYTPAFSWGAAIYSFAASVFSIYLTYHAFKIVKRDEKLSPLKSKWLRYILTYFLIRFMFWSLYFAFVLAFGQRLDVAQYTTGVVSFFSAMDVTAVFAISIFSFRHTQDLHAQQKGVAHALSPAQEEAYYLNLLHLMEHEGIYRRSDLMLNEVAALLNTNVKYVSQLIKLRTGHNFTTFVNTYRVNEIKSRIVDDRFRNLTIVAIAEECGFNSKATFNRVFKELTGTSPKTYREQHLKQVF